MGFEVTGGVLAAAYVDRPRLVEGPEEDMTVKR